MLSHDSSEGPHWDSSVGAMGILVRWAILYHESVLRSQSCTRIRDRGRGLTLHVLSFFCTPARVRDRGRGRARHMWEIHNHVRGSVTVGEGDPMA